MTKQKKSRRSQRRYRCWTKDQGNQTKSGELTQNKVHQLKSGD
nr:hypothetical protein [Mycoplasmopsis bovis]